MFLKKTYGGIWWEDFEELPDEMTRMHQVPDKHDDVLCVMAQLIAMLGCSGLLFTIMPRTWWMQPDVRRLILGRASNEKLKAKTTNKSGAKTQGTNPSLVRPVWVTNSNLFTNMHCLFWQKTTLTFFRWWD